MPSAIITVLCAFGFKTKLKWLYFIATAIVLAGAVLLFGFPGYIMFLAIILGALSLIAEIFWLAVYIKGRRKK